MRSDKSFIIYILILLLTPPIFYYMVVGEIPEGRYSASPGICFLGILLSFGIVYLFYRAQEGFFFKNIDFEDIGQDRPIESSPAGSQSGKRKKSGILNIFSRKNKCDHCGTEMEYKAEMDCYFCPECRDYK